MAYTLKLYPSSPDDLLSPEPPDGAGGGGKGARPNAPPLMVVEALPDDDECDQKSDGQGAEASGERTAQGAPKKSPPADPLAAPVQGPPTVRTVNDFGQLVDEPLTHVGWVAAPAAMRRQLTFYGIDLRFAHFDVLTRRWERCLFSDEGAWLLELLSHEGELDFDFEAIPTVGALAWQATVHQREGQHSPWHPSGYAQRTGTPRRALREDALTCAPPRPLRDYLMAGEGMASSPAGEEEDADRPGSAPPADGSPFRVYQSLRAFCPPEEG